jgi:hypothetical protein
MVCLSDDYHFTYDNKNNIKTLVSGEALEITAQEFILTSGEGNEDLLKKLPIETPKMQRRPLQMVLAKGKSLPNIYAHCIGASTKPIATITSHIHSDGDTVWYIGGNIAEDGVNVDSERLIQKTIKTLKKILPWADLDNIQWTTHNVNRAEPAQKNLLRPDTAFLASNNNLHIGWPTKLALTPNLSDQVISALATKHTVASTTLMQQENDKLLALLDPSFQITLAPNLWERSFHADS